MKWSRLGKYMWLCDFQRSCIFYRLETSAESCKEGCRGYLFDLSAVIYSRGRTATISCAKMLVLKMLTGSNFIDIIGENYLSKMWVLYLCAKLIKRNSRWTQKTTQLYWAMQGSHKHLSATSVHHTTFHPISGNSLPPLHNNPPDWILLRLGSAS